MATHDLDDLLDELDTSLSQLDRRHNRRLWSAVRGGPVPDVPAHADYQARLDRLLGDEDVAMRLDAAFRREGADRVRRRRSALWLSQAVATQAARQARAGAAVRQNAAIVQTFTAALGRERMGIDGLRSVLEGDPNRSRREQAYLALVGLARSLSTVFRETLAAHAAAWTPRGPGLTSGAGLWRQPLSPFTLEWQETDVAAVADKILRDTLPLLERFQHLAARAAGVRTLRAWDIQYALGRLAEPYERYFPGAGAATAIANGMRACGLPIDSLPLDLELAPRWLPLDQKGWPGRRWSVYPMQRSGAEQRQATGLEGVPGASRRMARPEVGVAVDPRPGLQEGLLALAHGVGAAVGIIHCRGGFLAEYRYGHRVDVAGAVCGFLVSEANWLAGQTAMPRSEVAGYLAVGCHTAGVIRAMRLREAAARAKAVWLAAGERRRDGGDAEADVLEAGAQLLQQAFGVPFDAEFLALDTAILTDPTVRAALLLRDVAAGQLAVYLRREHGKLMGDRRTGECLVECFWRHGALAPQPAALRLATGTGLDPGPEIDGLLHDS